MTASKIAAEPVTEAALVEPPRTRRRFRLKPASGGKNALYLIGLLPLALGLIAWEQFGDPRSFSFPPPSRWWESLNLMIDNGQFWPALWTTLETFALGLLAAIAVGFVAGWIIGASQFADDLVRPVLDFFRSMPAPALIPVVAVVLGSTSTLTGVVIMVTAVTWPILLNVASARRDMPPVRLEMGRVLGLSRPKRMFGIVLPSLLPNAMIGVRTAASMGLIVALVIDILGAGTGLGRLLRIQQESYNASGVWALIIVVGILGLLVNILVLMLDRYVQKGWR